MKKSQLTKTILNLYKTNKRKQKNPSIKNFLIFQTWINKNWNNQTFAFTNKKEQMKNEAFNNNYWLTWKNLFA